MTGQRDAARATILSLLMLFSMIAVGFTGAGAGASAGSVSESSDTQAVVAGDIITTGASPNVDTASELEGSGTEDDPYVITNVSELQAMGSDLDANYTLGTDIDASTTSEWNSGAGFEPIGNASTGFSGSFDGAGYTVSGLSIDRPNALDVGLFGAVDAGGTVENVHLREATVTGQRRTGLVAGGVDGFVNASSARGHVTGGTFVGGAAGDVNSGELENVTTTATVEGEEYVGGLAGGVRGSGVVKRSTARSTVNGGSSVGGFVGTMSARVATVSDSTAESTVTGTTDVGGFAGRIEAGTIERSTASDSVEGSNRVGGFVGTVAQDQNGDDGEIRNAATTADVEARDDTDSVGGFAGVVQNSSVATSYAAGQITGSATDPGGLVGNGTGATVTDSYWDIDATGVSDSNGGVGLNTSAMTGGAAEGNMSGFDFSTVWQTTESYPQPSRAETVGISGSISATSGASIDGDVISAFYQSDDDIAGADAEIEDGTFEIGSLDEEQSYNLAYRDMDAGEERNGVPDLYAIERVTPPKEVGEVTIPEAHNVSVRVTDRDGNPIEGATVGVEHENNGSVVFDRVENATNENGYAAVDGNTTVELVGNLTVGAEFNGFGNVTDETVEGDQEIVVELPLTAEISGQLNRPDGSNASSDLVAFDGFETDEPTETVTDGTGSFTATVPNKAVYEVYYAQSGSASSGPTYPLDGVPDLYPVDQKYVSGDTQLGEQNLPEGHRLNVTVETSNDEPLSNVTVDIANEANDARIDDEFETTEDGRIAPGGTAGVELAGLVTVELESDKYVSNERTVDLTEDESITLVAQEPVTVTGNITTAAGEATTGWQVVGDPESEEGRYDDARLDQNGSYALSLAQNTEYGIGFRQSDEEGGAAYPKDGVPDIAAVSSVKTGTNDTDLGTSQLGVGHRFNVTVTGPEGEPITDARVDVVSVNPDTDIGVGTGGTTNADGQLVLDGARTPGFEANGTVHVYVDSPDGSGLSGASEVYEIDTAGNDTIVLEPAQRVTGTVIEPDGETPAASERISVGSQSDEVSENVFTNGSGSFAATVPGGGSYSVGFTQVAGEGQYEPTFPQDGVPDVYALANVSSPSEAELGVRTLPQAHNLTVEVVGPEGQSVTDADVNIGSIANNATHYASGPVDPDGNFTVEVNGTVNVYVEPESDNLEPGGTGYFEVTENETVSVTLTEADSGSEASPTINAAQSSMTPVAAEPSEEREYAVSVTVDNTPLTDQSGEIDVDIGAFQFADGTNTEDDLTIAYDETDISEGTITASTTASLLAPTEIGEYAINVTDVRVGDGDSAEYLIEDESVEIATVGVIDQREVDIDSSSLPGSGTDADPYVVTNASQLQAIEDDLNATYTLGDDIDASTTAYWNDGRGFDPVGPSPPNGSTSATFRGTLDGNGHAITGLTVDRPSENGTGMFGYTASESTVENLRLKDISVNGKVGVGGLTGGYAGTTSNVTVNGSVTGNRNVGGHAGVSVNGTASGVSTSGTVTARAVAGGVVGLMTNGSAENVSSVSSVTADTFTGGLMGATIENATLTNASASGTVTGTNQIGGLVGRNQGESTLNYVSTSSTVNGTSWAGGVVGINTQNATVTNASASGTVTGTDQIGGLVGRNGNNGKITRSTTDNTVNGTFYVGGAVGVNDRGSTLTNASASGTVTGTDQIGGLVGRNDEDSVVKNSTADSTVNGTDFVGGAAGFNFQNATLANVSVSGAVSGESEVGGLAGMNEQGAMIVSSSANGSVTGTGFGIGGLLGRNDNATVVDATTTANVNGTDFVGGFVGTNAENATIISSSATGDVTGVDFGIGGFAGENGQNARIENATAVGNVSGSKFNTGGLIGVNRPDGVVRNVSATGDVTGESNVGGLVGDNDGGTVENATAAGSVNGTDTVGGLVAENTAKATISGASATGSVSGRFDTGGLVGKNERSATITDVSASGSVDGERYTGGLVGNNRNGTISDATATGAVNGTFDVGGLVGENVNGSLTRVTATGNVTGLGPYVGGLLGDNGGKSLIANASATGTVTGGEEGGNTGGLVGINRERSTVRDSFAAGYVDESGSSAGGLVGGNDGIIENSYWDVEATNQTDSTGDSESVAGATGLTTAEMTGDAASTNMDGLAFGSVWQTQSGGYPTLAVFDGTSGDQDDGTSGDDGDGSGDDGTGSDEPTDGGDETTDGEQAVFNVSNLNPQETTVTTGEPITVSAVVANDGGTEATQNVTFRVAGVVLANQNVTLAAGNETTIEFSDVDISEFNDGAYEHGVYTQDTNQTGVLTIEPQDADEPEDSDSGGGGSTGDTTPGFGPVVALVAVLSAAALLRRREGY